MVSASLVTDASSEGKKSYPWLHANRAVHVRARRVGLSSFSTNSMNVFLTVATGTERIAMSLLLTYLRYALQS